MVVVDVVQLKRPVRAPAALAAMPALGDQLGAHSLPGPELAALGVARLSFGPWSQRIALTALADTGAALLAGAPLPAHVRPLG